MSAPLEPRKWQDEQWLRVARGFEQGDPWKPRTRIPAFMGVVAPLAVLVACLGLSRQSTDGEWSVSSSAIPRDPRPTMREYASACVVTMLACQTSSYGQNMLVNGGLEGPSGSCVQMQVPSGSSAVSGWIVSGSWNIDWVRNQGAACSCPAEGIYYIDLNGSPNGVSGSAIRQSVATVVGTRYQLRLKAFASPYNTPIGTVKTLRVTTGTTVTDIPLVTGVSLEPPMTCADWPWAEQRVTFEATASTSLLELRSTFPNNAGGILIDDVTLVRLECPADIDGSGIVNGVDLSTVLGTWGVPNPKYPGADIDGDGLVNAADLALVLSSWGACP